MTRIAESYFLNLGKIFYNIVTFVIVLNKHEENRYKRYTHRCYIVHKCNYVVETRSFGTFRSAITGRNVRCVHK